MQGSLGLKLEDAKYNYSAKLALEMCDAARNSKKITKTLYFRVQDHRR